MARDVDQVAQADECGFRMSWPYPVVSENGNAKMSPREAAQQRVQMQPRECHEQRLVTSAVELR